MDNERQVLTTIAAGRNLGRAPTPELAALVKTTSEASAQLVARVETLPGLTSQANTAQLISQLRLMNDRVAFARRFYDDCVTRLADRMSQFPDSFVARLARVQPLPLLDVKEQP